LRQTLRLSDEQLGNLASVAQALDDNGIWWAIFAGTAAIYYGSARELVDVDILLKSREDIKRAHRALELFGPTKPGERKKGGLSSFGFTLNIPGLEVDVAAETKLAIAGREYPFAVDAAMENRVKKAELHKTREAAVQSLALPVVSAEDILVFKAIAQRGHEQGKFDLQDMEQIVKKQFIDWRYVEERARRCGAYERVFSVLPLAKR
jgi:hypothetical protein